MKRVIFALTLLLGACGQDAIPFRSDAGTDLDADSDSDSDSDTDTDTDSDTDSDVDTDSDSDTDTDTDSDTDSDTESETESETEDTDTDPLNCDGGRLDTGNNVCWQHPAPLGEVTLVNALAYCDGLVLEGHDDWALPSLTQVKTLLGDCVGDSVCDDCGESAKCSAMFDPPLETINWMSTIYMDVYRYYVGFDSGMLGVMASTSMTFSVRCVRVNT